MGQRIVHLLGTHLVPGRIPDGVLLGEHVRQELEKKRTAVCKRSVSTLTVPYATLFPVHNSRVTAMVLNIEIFSNIQGCGNIKFASSAFLWFV